MYLLLKHLHITAVAFSVSLFTIRAVWMLIGSDLHQRRWIRKTSQYIDTILLISAIALTLVIQHYPFVHGWLTAKVLALLSYIVFGTIALNRGKTRTIRIAALAIATLSVIYILAVARSHYPWPWLL